MNTNITVLSIVFKKQFACIKSLLFFTVADKDRPKGSVITLFMKLPPPSPSVRHRVRDVALTANEGDD